MAAFCITQQMAETLKSAARAGAINIEKMYGMTTAERRALFEQFTDKETAQGINTGFEKAMASESQQALKRWAEKTFTASAKKTARYKDVVAKINDLEKEGILTPSAEKVFLQDMVAERLGVTVTEEEAAKIATLSQGLEKKASEVTEFGTPSLEYFTERKKMDDYLDSLTPNSNTRVASETIARGNMLLGVKSSLLNIEANTIQGVMTAFERRITTQRFGGKNTGYALKYAKFVNDVYAKSGYDISRMMGLEGDRLIRGEQKANSQGSGMIRKVGRFYEDMVFKKTQGAPDVAFASVSFADRANLESTKIARAEGLGGNQAKERALEIFKDATSLNPQTPHGQAVRESAIADAMRSTNTDKTKYSDVSLGIRAVFNKASGDLRLGDQIMPFVKTPANVIGAGIDASGVMIPLEATMRLAKTVAAIRRGYNTPEALQESFKGFGTSMVRAGIGISAAFAVSNAIKPEDFMGNYPTSDKERRLLDLKKATPNSVRIGDHWISTDYFGAIGAPVVGLLYAKKYGKDLPSAIYNYYMGNKVQLEKLPGVDVAMKAYKYITQAPGSRTLGDEGQSAVNYLGQFMRSRFIPSFVSDVAKGTDESQRVAGKNDFVAGVKQGIPGLRQTLPEKKNVFGETMKNEPFLSQILFGSRATTATNDPVVKELDRLSQTGNTASLTDVSSTSNRVKELKQQVPETTFNQAMSFFGKNLKDKVSATMQSDTYKQADDEKKMKLINNVKDDELTRMLVHYGYKKPVKK